MEIGSGFDDDLFCETKVKNTQPALHSYNAKFCEAQVGQSHNPW